MKQHHKEFSRYAHSYDKHASIQHEVAKTLLSKLSSKPKKVLDLGCGSGAVYRQLGWEVEHFCGVDSSLQMCELHPKAHNIAILNNDFDSAEMWEKLASRYELIISSSALQWSADIESIFKQVSLRCDEIAFAIFTDNTFHALYEQSGLKRFLPNALELEKLAQNYFNCKSEIKTFRLFFDDNLSLFRYIKQSGVSGGEKKLGIAQTKALIKNYPYNYLEFELLFLWGYPRQS